MTQPDPTHPKPYIATEVFIALVIEIAAGLLFAWDGIAAHQQAWVLLGGTLLAVLVMISPAVGFAPLRFRPYRSRLASMEAARPPITAAGAFIAGDVNTGGGDVIGRDQYTFSGQFDHSTIVIQPPAGQAPDRLVSWTVLLSGAAALLLVLVRLVALAVIFIDLAVILVPALAVFIFLLTRFWHVDEAALRRLATTYLKIPAGLAKDALAVFRKKSPAVIEYGCVIVLVILVLIFLYGGLELFQQSSPASRPVLFRMNWTEYPGYRAKQVQEGMRLEKQGKLDVAVECYRAEMAGNPRNAAAYNNLAWVYAEKMGTNLDEAEQLALAAVRLTEEEDSPYKDDWLANHLDTLGWVYYQQGDYARAVETLEKARELTFYTAYRSAIDRHLEQARLAMAMPESP